MNIEEIFAKKSARKIFFLLTLSIVLVLLGLRYFVLPKFQPTLEQGLMSFTAKILEDTATSICVTVGMAAFFWWLTSPQVRNSGVVVVEPRELQGYFNRALAQTKDWQFFGGCGRYFRSAVLSGMTLQSRQHSSTRSVCAVILDPTNDSVCEKHARYRAGTKRGQMDGNWTQTRVKQELLATIIATKAVAHNYGLIDAKIYLSSYFSSFRVDLSDIYAIETREDPRAPALLSEADSYYFNALRDECRLIREQARLVEGGEFECAAVGDLPSIKNALIAMNLESSGLTDDELAGVVRLVKKLENPYE